MLSSLAWLTASATMHARRPVRRVGTSLCWEQQYERALHLHVPKVVGEASCCSCLVRTTIRGHVNQQDWCVS
ncbi:hypothetical protein EDB86DRAFT_2934521 [Lactarius hatsudake]|nr:hypothetical protein EDB86DRAFT_2934521 [Lactarius hatsudake]